MKNDFVRFIICFVEITVLGSIVFLIFDYLKNHIFSISFLINNIHIILVGGLIGTIIYYLRYCARHKNDE